MKRLNILSVSLFLLVPSVVFAQTSRSTNAAANKSWLTFWSQFSAAMNKRDKPTLTGLMSSDFEWALDGRTSPDEVFQIMNKYKYWKPFQRSIAKGVKTCGYAAPDCFNTTNTARRTKSPNWLLFEFRNGRWQWTRLIGD
jgi:hypothetical protein